MPVVLFLLALLLAGCATQTRSLLQRAPQGLPRQAELAATPFYPQERYQCGPAALAMSLNAAGFSASPDALVAQVYVPQREGSLQPEMLAAGRRHGALSVTIAPRLDALLTEIAAGNPVLVLQNLSLQWAPLWHYAVVIGYDLGREEIILRSGTTERLVLPMSTFEHTWARGAYWGMVTLPPDRLPATAEEAGVVDAVVALEKSGNAAHAHRAYATALRRWPQNLTLLLGYGNTAYASGDRTGAAAAYRRATEQHPESAAAFNNLATVLSELGQFDQARLAAEKAVALGGPWRDAAYATLQSIDAAQRKRASK
ncbi:PA2778 family cysteine peptidase [Noviherbaspirillum sp. UKPF54]|uniref:PA2778 family cysteine peptidase n=1 Tax=Noviherbaspirillum sp. UKPF54 TaxID=2601898 RepID=UPI0011B1A82D|nr:PA2778 family cysteine peptidase [Noviherbaspirillum sp. UKPF54]QDZ28737.1 tetratricopeptide repeat protein [Noviherbaspirillum sp. UKPF54]